jgi:hypothetical protein
LAGREDRPAAKKAKTIGPDGAKKLNDLAARKGVCLEEYLAAADVSHFQPLIEVAPEQARQVWRALQALPDQAPAAPPTLVATNGQASANGKPAACSSVQF